MAELICSGGAVLLHIQGYLFYKLSDEIGEKVYWECKNSACKKTAITIGDAENLVVQKEQADVEIQKRQLQLGQKVRKNQDPQRINREQEMVNIVSTYEEHFDEVAYNIRLWKFP